MSGPGGSASGLVTVCEANGEFEAQTLVAILAEAGIDAHVFPLATIPIPDPFRARAPGRMPVQVAAADLERATEAIAAARESAARIDWDEVEVGDPPPEVAAALGGRRRRGRLRFLALAIVAIAVLVAIASLASSVPWRPGS